MRYFTLQPLSQHFRNTLESNLAIDWFTKKKSIVNPDKFQRIILHQKKFYSINIKINLQGHVISSVPSVELLAFHLDDKKNFNLHISNISKSATN